MINYPVYKHTSPDNKVYIGLTSVPLAERWDNGFGYEQQPKFFREIVNTVGIISNTRY